MLRTSYATISLGSRLSPVVSQLAKPLLPLLLAVMGVLSGCDNGNSLTERRYCDNGGCYACVGDKCYPVPGDPAKPDPGPGKPTTCETDSACGTGNLCNLGRCVPACGSDASCAMGETCISGRCRPAGSQQCGIAGALCATDAQCGANRKCVGRACASDCTTAASCALGQVCNAGSCIDDPAPTSAQCQFDADCGAGKGGFRCINAYCLPTCTDNTQCKGGASCVAHTCRANRLP